MHDPRSTPHPGYHRAIVAGRPAIPGGGPTRPARTDDLGLANSPSAGARVGVSYVATDRTRLEVTERPAAPTVRPRRGHGMTDRHEGTGAERATEAVIAGAGPA